MKKCFLLLVMFLMLNGCTSLHCGEFFKHETIWKNWDHAYYSNFGYNNSTCNDVSKSQIEGWWGCSVIIPIPSVEFSEVVNPITVKK
jgi:hypothetical protein